MCARAGCYDSLWLSWSESLGGQSGRAFLFQQVGWAVVLEDMGRWQAFMPESLAKWGSIWVRALPHSQRLARVLFATDLERKSHGNIPPPPPAAQQNAKPIMTT